jgi:hypothetical protein
LTGTAAEAKDEWQQHRADLTLNFKVKAKQALRTGKKRSGEKAYI